MSRRMMMAVGPSYDTVEFTMVCGYLPPGLSDAYGWVINSIGSVTPNPPFPSMDSCYWSTGGLVIAQYYYIGAESLPKQYTNMAIYDGNTLLANIALVPDGFGGLNSAGGLPNYFQNGATRRVVLT